ncbi:MAG: hypothetical protein WB998_07670 [Solirubrobacteraceae bacterium]
MTRLKWAMPCLLLLALGLLGTFSASALARAGWEIDAHTVPANLRPDGRGEIKIRLFNVGETSSEGTVTVTDKLPPGVTAAAAGAPRGNEHLGTGEYWQEMKEEWICSGNGLGGVVAGATVVSCTNSPELPAISGGGGIPTNTEQLTPERFDPEIGIDVRAPAAQPSVPNEVSVAGGGAPAAANFQDPVTVSSTVAPFGFSEADAWFSNADGTVDTQAGSHPYEATFIFMMNTETNENDFPELQAAGGDIRNLTFGLPPGFVGNPYAAPQCTRAQFGVDNCPPSTQVGITRAFALGEGTFEAGGFIGGAPVYNLVPAAGEPAEFGFQLYGVNTQVGVKLRSGGNYSLASVTNNIVQSDITGDIITLWGEPGNPSHAPWWEKGHAVSEEKEEKPFLTLPTSCEGPQEFTLAATQWENPSVTAHTNVVSRDAGGQPIGFTGCEHLAFEPSVATKPDTSNADTPTGLTVEVKPATGGLLQSEGLGTSDIKETTVALPKGVSINPGQAAGLTACGSAEDAFTTPQEEAEGKENSQLPDCPGSSKVGVDEITLPILKQNLTGSVYVLESQPPHLKLLIEASGEGVIVKLIAHVELDEQTGQLVTTVSTDSPGFPYIPQAPVSDFKLSFSGGAQAALVTPAKCGVYTSESNLTPWGSPFVANAVVTSTFGIQAGTNGAPCPPSTLPYQPEMIAGSTTDQAGGYTDFSLLLRAPDDNQRTSRLQFKTPKGLLGMISKVPLCTNTLAEANACPASSQIGHTVVASGPGPYPLVVPQPGQPPAPIYLTESYEGAPYGLSIVVPLHVGPFVLPTQRVRAKIEVDPLTSQLTVTTDPLPQYVAGVPTDLRSINAVIDKPGFMFNPTNCAPQAFSGTATGTEGANVPISSHFQMGSCRALTFKPNFKVSTRGKTSRKNGASLTAKILYPTGALGANQASSQSNIASVKVDLPKQLPSRLTTLQKACPVATFNANPASCPKESIVGHATAITPVLPVPVTGPAYFVSHAGEEFPQLVIVLQGYGVTIDLVGDTFIDSKTNVTSSTFKQVPDVPIASFELNLPEGPYSALAAPKSLCGTKLAMPTAFTGQNGATIKQNTPITVTGCPKTKKTKKTKHKHKHHR